MSVICSEISSALSCLLLTAAMSGALAQPVGKVDRDFERGKVLAKHNCSRCHAVEGNGDSPHAAAPPFRELLKRYPIDALEESFVDTIYSNHPDMPVFKVEREQLDAILYYIASIQQD